MSRLQAALKARALAWLARREYSQAELLPKLRQAAQRLSCPGQAGERHALGPQSNRPQRSGSDDCAHPDAPHQSEGASPPDEADIEADIEAVVQATMAWLTQQGYASEQRFVESCLHRRASRWGGRRIEQELAQHGLALNPEQQSTLQEGEWDRAWAVWQRKFGAQAGAAWREGGLQAIKAKARYTRFLTARGFSPDTIRAVLRHGQSLAAESSGTEAEWTDPDSDGEAAP